MATGLIRQWNDGTSYTIRQEGKLIEFDVTENNGGCRFAEMTLCYSDGDKEVFDLVQIGRQAVGRVETKHRTLIFNEHAGIYRVILTPTDNG